MKQLIVIFTTLSVYIIFTGCKKNDNQPAPVAAIASVKTATGLSSGPKNSIIIIKGSNFITDLAKISVTVNGKSCTVLTAYSDSITARIPPYCGTGNVVLNLNGTIINGPVFTYVYTYNLVSINNGQSGYVDGPMATAKLEDVSGLCVDTADNIYTSSYSYPAVRKITADLTTISTLAGDRTVGDVNGQGTSAKLGQVDNISADINGNIYYADQTNNKVKKIDKLGNVSTFIPASAGFQPLTALAAKSGNVYVLGNDQSISKYNSSGVRQWKIASHGYGSTDGDSSVVTFRNISFGNAAVDAGEQYLYFASVYYGGSGSVQYASQVKRINLSTLVTTTIAGIDNLAGTTDGAANTATFKLVTGLALDATGGLYIADGFNNRIRYLSSGTVSTIIGAAGSGDVDGGLSVAKLSYPDCIALTKNGDLIIACASNNKIKRLIID
jgi:hypothetical protein